MRDIVRREKVAFFTDAVGNDAFIGDRVAVAVAKPVRALRIGEVLEITGCFYDGNWRDVRVKVKVDHKRGRYNPATGRYEDTTFIKTYDAANRVVKVA